MIEMCLCGDVFPGMVRGGGGDDGVYMCVVYLNRFIGAILSWRRTSCAFASSSDPTFEN